MLIFLMAIEAEYTRNTLEELYYHYRKLLLFIAYDILKDHHEAEDVVQSALIKICSHIEKVTDVRCNKTKGFLVIIVRNLAINLYNQRKKRLEIDIEEIENVIADETEVNPEQYILKIEQGEWVARQLALLNPEYADILVLRYTYQYTNSEIAHLLDISEGCVRTKLCRARKALYHIMKGEQYDERKCR